MGKIVGVVEDMEEKEEMVTTTTLTMEKEVGIHKQQEVVKEEIHGQEGKGEEEETLLLTCQNQVEEKRNKWYLDTGASNHMCGDRNVFVEIKEATTGNVSFGDDSKISVKGKEEDCWDYSVQEDMYDFLPYFEEEDEMEQSMIDEHITPPASPLPRLDETSSSERTPQLRSIEELYKESSVVTWKLQQQLTLRRQKESFDTSKEQQTLACTITLLTIMRLLL
ncbi:hypothetical protein KIW84_022391 [Lathyrus oleraceus]|uniref:Retrovirus-related Pol polyprotein from transposon TNT 1-94-like beta-barrel domain-containing protein n=1 Tax=Pisum sativum TaxID=3888 RepID=A0A9D4YEU5_PEA|nr:hypothetical protein KIW84_022391 [Pisum sativum]